MRKTKPARKPAAKTEPALRLLAELCGVPTAPFAERQVVRWVEGFCLRRSLHLTRDAAGNLLVSTGPAPRKGKRRLVLAAHMDHPGFVAESMDSPTTLKAHFRGGVLADYLVGTKVRFFTPAGEVPARVEAVATETPGGAYPTSAVLSVRAEVPAGSPGMFDLTPGKFAGKPKLFHSRVCDDLAGAAAALAALDQLRHESLEVPLAVMLTRAEEVGFVGALAAVHDRRGLLRKDDDLLLAIECSSEQPYARQHDGVILRVGDRTSIFNSSLTAFLHDTAQALQKADPTFKFQRALMPGGTCESTVYDAWGYHAAAVCVALGNYHNMDKAKKTIAPETVSAGDYLHMVRLFVELARTAHTYEPGHVALKARLSKRFDQFKPLLG